MEEDEELHTMWAHLLTNAADPSQEEPLASFAQVLKQLSRLEATFLNAFYVMTVEWQKSTGSQEVLVASVDLLATVGCEHAGLPISGSNLRLVIDDLQRLGLMRMDTEVFVRGRGPQPFYGGIPTYRQHSYFITDYAMSFVRACRASAT